MNENIVRLIKMKIINTFLISMPVANNLWEIWSVPPVVGDILFFILYTNTVKKSRTGICHEAGTRYYEQTKYFKKYTSIKDCIKSGGRLPKRR